MARIEYWHINIWLFFSHVCLSMFRDYILPITCHFSVTQYMGLHNCAITLPTPIFSTATNSYNLKKVALQEDEKLMWKTSSPPTSPGRCFYTWLLKAQWRALRRSSFSRLTKEFWKIKHKYRLLLLMLENSFTKNLKY